MGKKMGRGKQQVLLNFLPGRTFDFEKLAAIARVGRIRGVQRTDLNLAILLRKISESVRAWDEAFRPLLRNATLQDASRFVLLDPIEVQAEMFPRVLWCQNRVCGRVFDYTQTDLPTSRNCPACRTGALTQLRFVRIHRCGSLQPLLPPQCRNCRNSRNMALDTRGSERISNFVWVCRQCRDRTNLWEGIGPCRDCTWPGPPEQRRVSIEVHRAGRTFYAHTAVMLNIPNRQLDPLLSMAEWPSLVGAKYLELPEVVDRALSDFVRSANSPSGGGGVISNAELDNLLGQQAQGQLTAEQMIAQMQQLRAQRLAQQQSGSPNAIATALVGRSGVGADSWAKAGYELLEHVMPLEMGGARDISSLPAASPGRALATSMGISRLSVLADYPVITSTYAFSRAEYSPNECRLNPFPPERDYGGKFPIYVDKIQADAIVVGLSHTRVWDWLGANGAQPTLPSGTDPQLAKKAFFVRLFDDAPLHQTLLADRTHARMVFGLLHTLSHMAVRQAAIHCGLDRTSLSEYLMPRALSFAMYCNHRFGATIGSLTALFEQSLAEWLAMIRDTRRCVYDPVCTERNGTCHACTHLAETSCRFFNLNLGRAFLFGGTDPQLGRIPVGYFDMP